MRPEYLNLFELEVLESLLKDLNSDGDLKPSELQILEKITRITEYMRTTRANRSKVRREESRNAIH